MRPLRWCQIGLERGTPTRSKRTSWPLASDIMSNSLPVQTTNPHLLTLADYVHDYGKFPPARSTSKKRFGSSSGASDPSTRRTPHPSLPSVGCGAGSKAVARSNTLPPALQSLTLVAHFHPGERSSCIAAAVGDAVACSQFLNPSNPVTVPNVFQRFRKGNYNETVSH